MRQVAGYSLWLGHVGDVRHPHALVAAGIGAVVDLAAHEVPVLFPREVVYCRFPLVDGAENPAWLLRLAAETVAAMVRANVGTLVYCGAGLSRTPAIAAAGLSLASGCTLAEALARVTGGAPADLSPTLWSDVRSALA